MKYFLNILFLLFCVAQAQSQTNSPQSHSCGIREHECACATGSYCLKIGEACMTPNTSCPANVTDSSAVTCAEGEHECACSTGPKQNPER